MPTADQKLKMSRLSSAPEGIRPIPQIPKLPEFLSHNEEQKAALEQYHTEMTDLFKKLGLIQQ